MAIDVNDIVVNKLSYILGIGSGLASYASKSEVWQGVNWSHVVESVIVGITILLSSKLVIWVCQSVFNLMFKKRKK